MRYQVLREIGDGGMGVVYEGRGLLALGQELAVAIKVMRADCLGDPEALEMFAREALTSMRLNHSHENLVTTHDFGVSKKGRPYLVMELVDGASVREVGKVCRPGAAAVRRIARDALRGLGHLHAHEVIHRDVSAGNILLSRAGKVQVADFGLCRPADRSNSGKFRGTAAYAGPEALQGGELGPWSDLYSLGVVLYELITGRRPYGSGEPLAVFTRMANGSLKPLPADTPADLVELIGGLMALQVEQRLASAQAALAVLDRYGEPVADDAALAGLVEDWARTRPREAIAAEHALPSLGGEGWARERQRDRRRNLLWMLVPLAFTIGLGAAGLVYDLSVGRPAPSIMPARPGADSEATKRTPLPRVGDAAGAEPARPKAVNSSGGDDFIDSVADKNTKPAATGDERRAPTRRTSARSADKTGKKRKLFGRAPRVERTKWHITKGNHDENSGKAD